MSVAFLPVNADRVHSPIPVSVSRRERAGTGARLTRYRGGTYSSTVETVTFVDGTTARTDLIRLNPNVAAYSLDFSAKAPTQPTPYRADTWSALPNLRARDVETEVDWILGNSYPNVGTPELSRRLRDGGYSEAIANVAEHEAIAATQAAIWFFTNDLHLDNRPLNVPKHVVREPESITFEFDDSPQLGGYTIEVGAGSSVELQKSADGRVWQHVTASKLVMPGAGRYRKAFGVGATTARTRPGGRGVGYRFYRLLVTDGSIEDADVTFWLQGARHYRNADRIVQLYDYLLAGAQWAGRRASAPELSTVSATVVADRVGPFRLHADWPADLTVDNGLLVDAEGIPLGNVEPGGQFWLQPYLGADAATVTATLTGVGGRVVTGVAVNEADSALTPVVLTRPVPMVVEFALRWRNALRTDNFGADRRLHA
jgi:TQXA domain-containing protein